MKDKEELILKNRILDLAQRCSLRGIPVHTVFLNLYEQTIFHSMQASLPKLRHCLYGAYEAAERKIVCFLPCYEEDFNFDMLCVLKISPVQEKFADDLRHKDFLGAVMNLGIERNTVGDILIDGKIAYMIVLRKIAAVILEDLHMVRHTKVRVSLGSTGDLQEAEHTKACRINLASLRLDAMIAGVFHQSRAKVSELLMANLVFINGKQSTNHSYMVKEGDIISVRGLGRFRFAGELSTSKKGRLFVSVLLYI